MKLATFEVHTSLGRHRRIGCLIDEQLVDLTASYVAKLDADGHPRPEREGHAVVPPDMLELLRTGPPSLDAAAEAAAYGAASKDAIGFDGQRLRFDLDEVQLHSPLPRPNTLRDFMAFEKHVENGYASYGRDIPDRWYEFPVSYKGNPDGTIPPDSTVDWPPFTDLLDFEFEIAAVIGQRGRNIPADSASEYIAGFTIFNDFSARDIQGREQDLGFGPTKGKDFANGFGPYLVTPDEFDRDDAALVAKVNGEVWTEASIGDMYYSFEEMIEYISWGQTIHPGDVYGSGTVPFGCGKGLDRWIEPGDVIELEAEGIGVLRHEIGEQTEHVTRDYETSYEFASNG